MRYKSVWNESLFFCSNDINKLGNDQDFCAVVALKLKEIFGASDINDLPIFFNIAWYEQKAVIVLLALPVNLLGDVNIEDERNHNESQPALRFVPSS